MRMSYRVFVVVGVVLALAAGMSLYSCTISTNIDPEDTDFRVAVRGLPKQAKKLRLEVYDLGLLKNSNNYVKEVCEDRGEGRYVCDPDNAEVGGIVKDYLVRDRNSDRLFPDLTVTVPVKSGATEQSIWVISDNIGDLFLHLVVLTDNDLPYNHVCSCRRGRLKVNRGQLIPMPGDLYDYNPDLYKGLCSSYGLEEGNCFSCNYSPGSLFYNLPCSLLSRADGDEDSELEGGEGVESEDLEGSDLVSENELDDSNTDSPTEEDTDEDELPVGERFEIEAEDTVKLSLCEPSNKASVEGLEPNPLPFYGDPSANVVLLGNSYADATSLQPNGKLAFEFYVTYPGLYQLKVYYVGACFYAQAKAYIDSEPLSAAPFDIDMYMQAPDGQQCTEYVVKPFQRNTSLQNLGSPVFLSNGNHTLVLEAVSKRAVSKGYGIGLDRVYFLPVSN